MLTSLLFTVFGLTCTCLLHSSQAFYCDWPTMKDAYCLPGQQGRQLFLIQGTVVEEGTVERERGPHWGENRYQVSVEKVYRDDTGIIQEGSTVTVVTTLELHGGQWLYLNKDYIVAGHVDADAGETLLRTDECEYHRCIRDCFWGPDATLPITMPSCGDADRTPQGRGVKKMGLRSQTWQVPELLKMRARSMRKESVFP